MILAKNKPIRSKALTEAAEDQPCVRCGKIGTTVAAHYQGDRSLAFSKGKGIKPHDLCIADLCHECHTLSDNYQLSMLADPHMKAVDHSEQFMYYILLTLVRRVRQGILEV